MKINKINHNIGTNAARAVNFAVNKTYSSPKVISLSDYLAQGISFTGENTKRNKAQVIFIGAESDPYSKAGGVGTVMKDYRSFTSPNNQVEIIPYYGANNDKENGCTPLKDKDGNYIMKTNKGTIKLDLVEEKEMQWGKDEHSKIMLFKEKGSKNSLSYFVFTDEVSSMKKPYQRAYVYQSGAKQKTNGWNGDPYAKFSKAAVEFLPKVMQDKSSSGNIFNPATVVCSDSQTAYVIEYMAQHTINGEDKDKFDGIKPTYVGHNLGPGYCGETSMQNMFVNLGATKNQIEQIENDPIYQQGIKGDEYFKPYVKETLDETGTASAVEIPIHWADKDYVKAFSVVAEDYAESIANNPQTAHNIHKAANKLYEKGVFNGILNPLNDPAVDSTKELLNTGYNKDLQDSDGKIYKKFELYPKNPTYQEICGIKNRNKAKLLERFSAKDTTIITGNPNRPANINPEAPNQPVIKPELLQMAKDGKANEIPLFVSWGRSDTQKGHNITLSAFEKFAKTKEGKNAILIIGSGLDDSMESKKMEKQIKSMLEDKDLQGRIVHIDGWAPAYALASAADAAIFSSRFEPCGLTDLEAMKYYCTPIVTNTQGLKQKNFDPRQELEREKATSYKTTHEYNLLKSQVEPIIDYYVKGKKSALAEVQREFPTFFKLDENGCKIYDDTLFKAFAKDYSKYIKERKAAFEEVVGKGESLPNGWDDWDEMSKDYHFQFDGCARDLKDGILASEMAEAISACTTADKATKALIAENLKNLNTGWNNNNNLHPSGKSSKELYEEHHLNSEYTEPNEDDLLNVKDEDVKAEIEKSQNEDMQSRVKGYSIASLTGILGLISRRLNKAESQKAQQEAKEALQNEIENLKGQINTIKKANKKNLLIVGIAAAACASAATFIATRFYAKKRTDKKQSISNNQPFTEVNSVKANEPARPKDTLPTMPMPSMQAFKDSLNNKIA